MGNGHANNAIAKMKATQEESEVLKGKVRECGINNIIINAKIPKKSLLLQKLRLLAEISCHEGERIWQWLTVDSSLFPADGITGNYSFSVGANWARAGSRYKSSGEEGRRTKCKGKESRSISPIL